MCWEILNQIQDDILFRLKAKDTLGDEWMSSSDLEPVEKIKITNVILRAAKDILVKYR